VTEDRPGRTVSVRDSVVLPNHTPSYNLSGVVLCDVGM
jgi:hypothetical protein